MGKSCCIIQQGKHSLNRRITINVNSLKKGIKNKILILEMIENILVIENK